MDETFQKRISLRVKKEEWRRNRYTCVVQHKSLKKDIEKILTEDEIISNHSTCNRPYATFSLWTRSTKKKKKNTA